MTVSPTAQALPAAAAHQLPPLPPRLLKLVPGTLGAGLAVGETGILLTRYLSIPIETPAKRGVPRVVPAAARTPAARPGARCPA